MGFSKDVTLFLKDGELIPSEEFIFHRLDNNINLKLSIKELNNNSIFPYYSLIDLDNINVSFVLLKNQNIINEDLYIQDNIINLIITSNMTDIAGEYYFQLNLKRDDDLLRLPKCKFKVIESLE